MDYYTLERNVRAKYRGLCPHCLKQCHKCHHIIARSANGPDTEENLIPLCIEFHDFIHTDGWQNHVQELYALQRKAQLLFNHKIVVGGE